MKGERTSLKVALISDHASPLATLGGVDAGGQNVYVAQLARRLAATGVHVDVFTRRTCTSQAEIVPWEGVRVIHVPAGPPCHVPKEQLLPYMDGFTDWVEAFAAREGAYGLFHANFFLSGLVAADLKVRTGTPFVVTFHALGKVRRLHQGAADAFPDERMSIEARLVRAADALIAECPQDVDDLMTLYGADASQVHLIPCGFDPAEFEPLDKEEVRARLERPALPQDAPLLLQLGRMVPRKGVETVVRALVQVEKAHLLVVGGESAEPDPVKTPEIGRLQEVANEVGVASRVHFLGQRPREDLKHLYAAADVFVTTPWYEPFGITPLEAMACARPVVGSNVGGVKYSVVDGETGLLVPPRDPDALATALNLLLTNPKRAEAMGRRGRARVLRDFTWEQVAGAMRRVYEEVALPPEPRLETYPFEHDLEPTVSDTIDQNFTDAVRALERSRQPLRAPIAETTRLLTDCFRDGNKLLVCGNGGSAADAQHLAAELVGRFLVHARPGLPVIALNTDTSVLTAWANDVGFADVFARQVQALGQPGDALLVISTSGASENLVRALREAKAKGMTTLALLGKGGGAAARLADVPLVVPEHHTPRIQEVHTLVLHLLCELVENEFIPVQQTTRREVGLLRPIPVTND